MGGQGALCSIPALPGCSCWKDSSASRPTPTRLSFKASCVWPSPCPISNAGAQAGRNTTRPEIWSKIKAMLQETQQENDKHNVFKSISQRCLWLCKGEAPPLPYSKSSWGNWGILPRASPMEKWTPLQRGPEHSQSPPSPIPFSSTNDPAPREGVKSSDLLIN